MLKFNDENEIIQDDSFRAILVGVSTGKDISRSMEELGSLVEAASGEVAGVVVQNLERINKATYLGKGKVEEVAEACETLEVDTVVFDDELSGMQIRNLEDKLGVRVIDRTILILDIFAARATSKEGKLQVELAQLQYRLPRLLGFGKSLSRQGGGVGTRGPGEKKLETDRRHIQSRVDDIKAELKQAEKTRQVKRAKRDKAEIPIVALVGYTNSGKSALMNRFMEDEGREEKQVYSQNMLFATLDAEQRSVEIEKGKEFILVDTVGFVSKLPHSLVEAFKATLEEAVYADLLIHVVDTPFEDVEFNMDVTDKVLKEIGADGKETIVAYNKADLLSAEEIENFVPSRQGILISAKTGEGMDELTQKIKETLFKGRVRTSFLVPYSRGDIVSYLCDKGQVFDTKYEAEGTLIDVEVSAEDYERVKGFEA